MLCYKQSEIYKDFDFIISDFNRFFASSIEISTEFSVVKILDSFTIDFVIYFISVNKNGYAYDSHA